MAYVDYKCLESLLIEGEDLIATEGFVGSIINKIIAALQYIGKLIDKLINFIKAKFKKQPPKSSGNTPSNTQSSSSSSSTSSNNKPPVNFTEKISDEKAKEMADKIRDNVRNSKRYKELVNMDDREVINTVAKDFNSIKSKDSTTNTKKAKESINIYSFIVDISKIERMLFEVSVNRNYMEHAMDKDDHDISLKNTKVSEHYAKIKDMTEDIDGELDKIINDYDAYYISLYNSSKEDILSKLSNLKSDIDKNTKNYTDIYNLYNKGFKTGNDYFDKQTIREMTPTINLINKIGGLITKLTNIVNNCEIQYNNV